MSPRLEILWKRYNTFVCTSRPVYILTYTPFFPLSCHTACCGLGKNSRTMPLQTLLLPGRITAEVGCIIYEQMFPLSDLPIFFKSRCVRENCSRSNLRSAA